MTVKRVDQCKWVFVRGSRTGERCPNPGYNYGYCAAHKYHSEEYLDEVKDDYPTLAAKPVVPEKVAIYDVSFHYRSDQNMATFLLEQFMRDFIKELKAKPAKVEFSLSVRCYE